MDFTEYWSIIERDHHIQNPSTPEKLALLADYCRVRDGMRVLDIGSGKGWLLRSWAERWAIHGTGLEINPWFAAEARAAIADADLASRLTFIEGPAADFEPDPGSYDVVMCIGASFALGSFDEAVEWMRRAVRPGGVIVVGEPFANEPEVPAELLAEWGDAVRDLPGLVMALEGHDVVVTGMIISSVDDWDRYESPKWRAALEWSDLNPTHPGRDELLTRVAQDRERYLRWERRYLGWGIFVAQ